MANNLSIFQLDNANLLRKVTNQTTGKADNDGANMRIVIPPIPKHSLNQAKRPQIKFYFNLPLRCSPALPFNPKTLIRLFYDN